MHWRKNAGIIEKDNRLNSIIGNNYLEHNQTWHDNFL